MNIHGNHERFVAALENQWPACYSPICKNIVARWKLQRLDNTIIYVYTNDMRELDTLTGKHRAKFVTSCGYRHCCTNTIEGSDLCDYTDPKQYMPWRSHNQPHG